MLPPHRPFRSKVVSNSTLARNSAPPSQALLPIGGKPRSNGRAWTVRGRRVTLKSELRVVAAPPAAAEPRS